MTAWAQQRSYAIIAESHFSRCEQTALALAELRELFADLPHDSSRMALLQNLSRKLHLPWVIAICGPHIDQRVALMHALCGKEVFGMRERQLWEQPVHVLHGPPENTETDGTITAKRLAEGLRRFEFLQIPTEALAMSWRANFPSPDLVIHVSDMGDPWNHGWSQLQPVKGIEIMVLDHMDLRGEDEANAIAEHLQTQAEEVLSARIPAFLISSKKAILSRTTGRDKKRLYQESGLGPVEDFLTNLLKDSSRINQRDALIEKAAGSVLEQAEHHITLVEDVVASDEQVLENMDQLINENRDQAILEILSVANTLGESLEDIGDRITEASGRWKPDLKTLGSISVHEALQSCGTGLITILEPRVEALEQTLRKVKSDPRSDLQIFEKDQLPEAFAKGKIHQRMDLLGETLIAKWKVCEDPGKAYFSKILTAYLVGILLLIGSGIIVRSLPAPGMISIALGITSLGIGFWFQGRAKQHRRRVIEKHWNRHALNITNKFQQEASDLIDETYLQVQEPLSTFRSLVGGARNLVAQRSGKVENIRALLNR